MARLLVFRGETVLHEIELVRLPFRIGRGEQNDLVLEDPVKSVSRVHAEIRFEGGRYMLVDLESQNGIWFAGNRVPSVALEPMVVASLGRFRVTVEGDAVSDTSPIDAAAGTSDAESRYADPAGDLQAAQPRLDRGSGPAGQPTRERTRQRKWVVGGVAGVAAAGAITAGVLYFRPHSPPDPGPEQLARFITAAQTQIAAGECALALTQNIEPALVVDPNNAAVVALQRQAQGCVPPPPPPPPPPLDETEEHLKSAAELIEVKDCATALSEHINKVLEKEPDNSSALELKKRASECIPTVTTIKPPTPPSERQALRISPETGGLDPLPGETDPKYQIRIQEKRVLYDDALAQIQRGNFRAAISSLESLRRTVPAGYLELDAKLAAARKGLKERAESIRATANDLEQKNDWDAAIQEYRRAHEIDPDLSVEADIKRVSDQKTRAGEQACESGRKAYALAQVAEYRRFYQLAFRLLPPGHPCYETAKERSGI